MKKELIDAVKTAKSIHKGDYSSLRRKSFVIIDNSDKIKKNNHRPGDNTVKKSRMDRLEGRMDRLDERMDRLEGLITNLVEEMRNGFKQVNSRIDKLEKRIDRIDTRLDYIVKANNLKDSK